MWLVEGALRRPYTVAVMAILILTMGVLSLSRMVVDIFPSIDIPVVAVVILAVGVIARERSYLTVGPAQRSGPFSAPKHL